MGQLIQTIRVPEAALFSLALFVGIFAVVLVWVFAMEKKSNWDSRALIPLQLDEKGEEHR